MLIIIDKRAPDEAKQNLADYGSLVEFETDGIVYEAISGHTDIFFCQTPEVLIVAPNTPNYFIDILISNKINFKKGFNKLGEKYPETSSYNALVTADYLIHNLKTTDKEIINATQNKVHVQVNQSYTKCNLLEIAENRYITSDMGIYKSLNGKISSEILFVNPVQIELSGYKNGFIGGCCGVYKNNLFMTGNLKHFNEGDKIRKFVEKAGVNLIELCDRKLFDVGSILFIESDF